ncbi:MAG: PEGA domain-containing protein [FCB group bacterium]|nr:PEGA domain-containing protein [FCB group bacterium]
MNFQFKAMISTVISISKSGADSSPKKILSAILAVVLLLNPVFVFTQENIADSVSAPDTEDPLQKAIDLYYKGDFDNATVILSLIIDSGRLPRENLIKAYEYLGASFILHNHPENARNEFIRALKLEPKLTMDPLKWDPKVFNYFNLVKSQVLGSLQIETIPIGATVLINDLLAGSTPLHIENLVSGDYIVEFEKSGYISYSDTVEVRANIESRISITLKRKANNWLYASGVIAAGTIIYFLLTSEPESTELEPLGSPPDPPGDH